MADGKCRAEWGHTSSVLAVIASVNRDPKRRSRPYSPAEFNPYCAASKRGRAKLGTDISVDQLAREMTRMVPGARPGEKGRKKD